MHRVRKTSQVCLKHIGEMMSNVHITFNLIEANLQVERTSFAGHTTNHCQTTKKKLKELLRWVIIGNLWSNAMRQHEHAIPKKKIISCYSIYKSLSILIRRENEKNIDNSLVAHHAKWLVISYVPKPSNRHFA